MPKRFITREEAEDEVDRLTTLEEKKRS